MLRSEQPRVNGLDGRKEMPTGIELVVLMGREWVEQ